MARVDVVFFDETITLRRLVVGRSPRHIEDSILRPDVSLRVAMALQTPAHRERLLLTHQRHILHRPVTGGAANAVGDMDAVIKENVVRQAVYALPMERHPGLQAFAHWRQHRGVSPYLRMAGHTDMGGWNPRKRGLLGADTAHSAIQPEVADMVRWAWLNATG